MNKTDFQGGSATSDLPQGLPKHKLLPHIQAKSDSQTSLKHEENNTGTRFAGHMVKSDTVQTTDAPSVDASSLQIQEQASAENTQCDVTETAIEYNKLKDKHSKLQKEKEKQDKDIENLQELNQGFIKQIKDLLNEKLDFEKKAQKSEQSHDSISRENKQLKTDFKTITDTKNELNQKYTSLCEQNKGVKTALDTKNKELQELQECINHTKKDKTDYVTKLAGAEAVISQCMKVKEDALKVKEELTEEKKKLEEVCNTQKRTISTIEKRYDHLI